MKFLKHSYHAIPIGSTLAVEHDLCDQLSEAVEREGTQTAIARDLGVSTTYLRDVLQGRRAISEAVADKLGWRKMTVFVR